MILVTTGTNEQAFDRLVRAATALPETVPLLVQYGSSNVPHGPHGEWVDFLSFDELRDAMERADAVVSHAGVGSILLAQRCGKRPIVMPRQFGLGEAVDDHQLPFARRLASIHSVTLVEDEDELSYAVSLELDRPFQFAPAPAAAAGDGAGQGLTAEVRDFLGECTAVRWS